MARFGRLRSASAGRSAGGGRAPAWKAVLALACIVNGGLEPVLLAAQQPPALRQPAAEGLPQAPAPVSTEPLFLRPTGRDFTRPRDFWRGNPLHVWAPTDEELPNFHNAPRLRDLLHGGKIYLSLGDAIALTLENNFDIAIARYNLDIADTDVLRARSGSSLRGVSSGLVTGTLGGSSQTLTSGGGPGGTSAGVGGAGAGSSGIVSSTNGAGPQPENLDPYLQGTVSYERSNAQQTTTLITGTSSLNTDTNTYDFQYNQGFVSGTALQVTWDNSRVSTNSRRASYNPGLQSNFRVQGTQHLLQGFGPGVNRRFIVEAINDRRITDSSFRQQILYTVNQVENIYWALVSAYEDVQAKERALEQSRQLTADNRKQLEIGTLAPLDVVNSDSQVATDQQALISSQSNLEYQQLLMKQAVARNLEDREISQAPVIPTDRVSLAETPEERLTVEELVNQAYANRPEIEQAVLNLKNSQITLRGVKNGLLPVVDAYAFYASSALGGKQNPLGTFCGPGENPSTTLCNEPVPDTSFGTVTQNLFNNKYPDWSVGVNVNIPLRNRTAQADQARAVLEYRQAQMRLAQLYTQVRMQVINQQFALTNDRAQVQASLAAREFAGQSLDAERKKYRLGASTTANVLQQQRNLATAENNVIIAQAAYAKDRALLNQILANTLNRYGILMNDAVSGQVSSLPLIPGLEAPRDTREVKMPDQQQLEQQQQQPPQATPPGR